MKNRPHARRGRADNNLTLKQAAEALRCGEAVVYPTETAYGLGVDALNEAAVRRVYQQKGRKGSKLLSVVVARRDLPEFFELKGEAARLAKKFWPGPLSLVLPAKSAALRKALGTRFVAVRVSSHPLADGLARRLGGPIVATSANPSGEPAHYSLSGALKSLGDENIFGLDGGTLPRRPPSTMVEFEDGRPIVLRQGSIRI